MTPRAGAVPMRRIKARGRLRWSARAAAIVIGAAAVLVAPSAHAHFILLAPPSWMSQDPAGLPEKLGPCGDEGGGTPTGIVTAIIAMTPIVMLPLARIFEGERISAREITGGFIAVAGVTGLAFSS